MAYIVIPVAVVLFFGWKWWHKTQMVGLDHVDLDTGRRLIDDFDEHQARDEPRQQGRGAWYTTKKLLSRAVA